SEYSLLYQYFSSCYQIINKLMIFCNVTYLFDLKYVFVIPFNAPLLICIKKLKQFKLPKIAIIIDFYFKNVI
ncbi:hypothetical protein, partial [Enterobacter ludwigii]|uniref:hypothetical protein n=1 Tax=Enterobacter ludwigii TaxID=299767 RepID=UPI002A800013